MSFQNICSPNCGHILWSVPFPSIYLPPARISRPTPHFKNLPLPPNCSFLMPPLSLHSSGRVLTSDRNLPLSDLHFLTTAMLCICLSVLWIAGNILQMRPYLNHLRKLYLGIGKGCNTSISKCNTSIPGLQYLNQQYQTAIPRSIYCLQPFLE